MLTNRSKSCFCFYFRLSHALEGGIDMIHASCSEQGLQDMEATTMIDLGNEHIYYNFIVSFVFLNQSFQLIVFM